MDKKHLRTLIKQRLAEMSEETFRHYSKDIHQQLFSLQSWKEAHTIAVTISNGREVDTTNIIERAWQDKKRIVVPKCDPKTNTMEFRQITSFDQLERVFFGLLEPKVLETEKVSPNQIDLMIIPGICYDRRGYRIGYGGGYFDRYLTHYKNDTLSLAFSMQIVEKVPAEPHDLPVSTIITECGVIN
ncbi:MULTISPECIES: 5-formyltetrahydrofolate cyclo-ligase [Metabacillus]|uniref:5-formyltetrahydrofolate cyclo-ligase n=2 Tax=Metabacillus TaxID=2675233 RepID=A0A179SUK5_9BACI|nr:MULTISPECIES: 5-formyltetrahydrofolate cyclo-ligase [Metabacillus]OAS85074.1 5-formyltetrahydrofolate cyclo-ligase [Metabacillus litoralis]QNF26235.1 5-formyltetrahydrofolate cyclo-ligase [Metabacillus sp. KUDC1714]